MEEFILIMRHEDGKKLASPEQMQIWMKQTMDWIGGIAAQSKFSSIQMQKSKSLKRKLKRYYNKPINIS